MEIYDVTISSQGQVTVPVALRRRLGLDKGAKLRFVADRDGVRVMATPWTLESVIGSVAPIPGREEADLDLILEEAFGDDLSERMPWSARS